MTHVPCEMPAAVRYSVLMSYLGALYLAHGGVSEILRKTRKYETLIIFREHFPINVGTTHDLNVELYVLLKYSNGKLRKL